MEEMNTPKQRNGYRKRLIKDQNIKVRCTYLQRKIIEKKAEAIQMTLTEYMRETALSSAPKVRAKAFPKEVLLFIGTLNQLANYLQQVAYRRIAGDELNALERARLHEVTEEIRNLVININHYLR